MFSRTAEERIKVTGIWICPLKETGETTEEEHRVLEAKQVEPKIERKREPAGQGQEVGKMELKLH